MPGILDPRHLDAQPGLAGPAAVVSSLESRAWAHLQSLPWPGIQCYQVSCSGYCRVPRPPP